jgi:hypothetical protein
MEVIKQSHTSLQKSVKADLTANNEKIQSFQNSVMVDNEKLQRLQESVKTELSGVKADLSSVKADSSKFIQLQEANIKFQEKLRAETKAENEKLAKRIEQQSQQSNKEFAAKLDSEARRLTNLAGQVEKETESELVAMKKQLQVVNMGFESRLEQSSACTQSTVDELANQIVDHRSEVEATISKLEQCRP